MVHRLDTRWRLLDPPMLHSTQATIYTRQLVRNAGKQLDFVIKGYTTIVGTTIIIFIYLIINNSLQPSMYSIQYLQ